MNLEDKEITFTAKEQEVYLKKYLPGCTYSYPPAHLSTVVDWQGVKFMFQPEELSDEVCTEWSEPQCYECGQEVDEEVGRQVCLSFRPATREEKMEQRKNLRAYFRELARVAKKHLTK
jgi:hypothetical protein